MTSTTDLRKYQVYRAVNEVNGKAYIGITRHSTALRWKEHLKKAAQGSPYRFHAALRKYGASAFRVETLLICQGAEAAAGYEMALIRAHSTYGERGYNATLGGDGARGITHSAEAREKIAAANRGKKLSPSTRAKLRETPKAFSQEARAKISATHTGKEVSPETRAKMAASRRGRTLSPETRTKLSEAARNRSEETLARMAAARRPLSEEAKAKISLANSGRPQSEGTREKRAAKHRGMRRSEETRRKMTEANLRRWAKVREALQASEQ